MNLDEQIAHITTAFERGQEALRALYAVDRTEGSQMHLEGYTLHEIIVHLTNAVELSRRLRRTLERRRRMRV